MKDKINVAASLLLSLALLFSLPQITRADNEENTEEEDPALMVEPWITVPTQEAASGENDTSEEGNTPNESSVSQSAEPQEQPQTQVLPEDVFSVELPAVYDGMLDFLVDPQGLVEATGAARYGGGIVEKGSTVLFRRAGGAFSDHSEPLYISNTGDCPVEVTVHISVDTPSEVPLTMDSSFSGDERTSIYLALTDNDGWEFLINPAKGHTSHTIVIQPGQKDYCFGLHGASNPSGNWADVDVDRFRVTLSWAVTPILPEVYETVPVEDSGNFESTPGSLQLFP